MTRVLSEANNKHIPGKVKRFNKRKHFKHKWMTSDLLSLINKEKIGTVIGNQLLITFNMKKKFKTLETIVNNEISATKSSYYFKTFTAQNTDMKKLGQPSMKH